MKLSDYVIDFIVKQGVSHVFEFVGGAIVHLLDSTYDRSDIQCVSVHHEQTGAFAAEAYARINGKLGVAMATSGPGALNMLTGIGSCYFDSVPCLFITGQVNTYEYKFDSPIRQIGFQETDIVSVATPLTKYAELVVDSKKIRYHLEKAVYMAQSGRPGPVLLDIPMNVQRAQIDPDMLESFFDSEEYKQIEKRQEVMEKIDEFVNMIGEAKRPVILVGGGVRTANATDELLEFVSQTGFPVVTSLMGLDAIPHDNKAFVGMIGAYGNRYSNLALANCDLLLVLGSRLDTRQTGTRPDTFARASKKIQIDIDMVELNYKIKMDLAIHYDVKEFLVIANKKIREAKMPDISSWYERIQLYKEKYPTASKLLKDNNIEPNAFIELLSRYSKEGDIICLDVGQHQMWAAQSFRLKKNQRMLNSGGMGSMGFALPAAIGAVKAYPEVNGIVIAGDGGIQINIQELDLIATHQLPIKIVVLNNGCLGMVRQFQDIYFEGRRQSTVLGYSCPNLIKIAEAYGIDSYEITSLESAGKTIEQAFSDNRPAFINVKLELATVVNPKLVVNRPIEDMYPHLDRAELGELMEIDLVEEIAVPG
ncbi:thiamine pyrophosphate-binding protein [Anaerospora hongkongensis]|uniref:thiamine pyrophosphate-binding protein n=1 Tax=Anaerospora hongkongensis TaxID=244830 RepID=UPI00289F09D0|nr:thiamine pyrophosphate-binding protein [Anaerospora hongkongensis]